MKNKKLAISIVEVVVIIAIISVGLTGVYNIMLRSIRVTQNLENKIQAINIAREGIEAMENIRDTNWLLFALDKNNCWNTLNYDISCLGGDNTNKIKDETSYKIDRNNDYKWLLREGINGNYTQENYRNFYQIRLDDKGFYTHSGSQELLPIFTREIKTTYVPAISSNTPENGLDGLKVESIVYWADNSSNQTHEIILETILTNHKKYVDKSVENTNIANPINGLCGNANGNTFTSKPTINLCQNQATPEVTENPNNTFTWLCPGEYGGNNSSTCSANKIINGTCGTANNTTTTQAPSTTPTTNLCNTGIPSTISGSGPWTWTCTGSNGGNNATCSANPQAPTTCQAGYYLSGGTCISVGTGYYSPAGTNTRTACTNKPTNSTYTGNGGGTNSCPWGCSAGYYSTNGTTCIAVGVGYYSTVGSNSRGICVNKPTNSTYSSNVSGTSSCPYSCNSGYTQSGSTCVAQPTGTDGCYYSKSSPSYFWRDEDREGYGGENYTTIYWNGLAIKGDNSMGGIQNHYSYVSQFIVGSCTYSRSIYQSTETGYGYHGDYGFAYYQICRVCN